MIMTDLETHFPNFAGPLAWDKIPDGQDPPDFRSGRIGLELVEWLDGDQMSAGKGRESQRDQIHRILASNWQGEYSPRHFRGAFLTPGGERIPRKEEGAFRAEFYALAAAVDSNWSVCSSGGGQFYRYDPNEFSGYPTVAKHCDINFIGGDPHGLCWIHPSGDGGPYDPLEAVRSLEGALHSKLAAYSTPGRQAHLESQDLTELSLLVHGGFNGFAYNAPFAPLTLDEVAERAAAFYNGHADRERFSRVWLFYALDSAEEVNKAIGFEDSGTQRWLCQLWPDFHLYPSPTVPHKGS